MDELEQADSAARRSVPTHLSAICNALHGCVLLLEATLHDASPLTHKLGAEQEDAVGRPPVTPCAAHFLVVLGQGLRGSNVHAETYIALQRRAMGQTMKRGRAHRCRRLRMTGEWSHAGRPGPFDSLARGWKSVGHLCCGMPLSGALRYVLH